VSTEAITYEETFRITYNSRSTEALNVLATPGEVENAINRLGIVGGVVSADREDNSIIYDGSGIETYPFNILFRVTVFGSSEDIIFGIDSSGLGDIQAHIRQELLW
jgi:hypothetical protein